MVWAVKKCNIFLRVTQFDLIVDHKALVQIINSKSLNEIETPRIFRLKEKLAYSMLTAQWRAGVNHKIVDLFSRYPVDSGLSGLSGPRKIYWVKRRLRISSKSPPKAQSPSWHSLAPVVSRAKTSPLNRSRRPLPTTFFTPSWSGRWLSL